MFILTMKYIKQPRGQGTPATPTLPTPPTLPGTHPLPGPLLQYLLWIGSI